MDTTLNLYLHQHYTQPVYICSYLTRALMSPRIDLCLNTLTNPNYQSNSVLRVLTRTL
jgi:hypothetical protein